MEGIGAFILKFPQYQTLYGTVSLSRIYKPQSTSAIGLGLPMTPADVQPTTPYTPQIDPELRLYIEKHSPNFLELTKIVRNLEEHQRDIPVLLKQYHRLGAKFYTLGVDQNFNQTPGLLLSVNINDTPPAVLKKYMGPL